MAEHAGVTRAKEYLEIFATGDLDALQDFYSDDVLWHVGGNHPLSGDYRGKDALFDYFGRVRELTSGSLTLEPETILASDRHTAMFLRVRGARGDRKIDVIQSQVLKVGPDGRWCEYWAAATDQDQLDRFWL
jgi:ketosteroid isomerase-like protein